MGDSGTTSSASGRANAAPDSGSAAGAGVRLGAPALGPRGRLGEIHRMIVDPQSGCVTDLVVSHGGFAGGETVVPLTMVREVDEHGVHLALGQPELESLLVFAETRYAVPDSADVVAGRRGVDRGALLAETGAVPSVAYGGQFAATDPAPLANAITTAAVIPDAQRPVVSRGLAVYDVNGEKLGTVGQFAADPSSGRAVHLALHHGLIMRHDTELPVTWIDDISPRGVLLTVTKEQVERVGHGHGSG